MTAWWLVVGGALGFALGLWSGQVLLGLFVYWQSIETAVKVYKSLVMFLCGAGGGAAIIGLVADPQGLAGYAIGLAAGLIVGRAMGFPNVETPDQRTERAALQKGLPPEIEGRDLLIGLATEAPKRVQLEKKLDPIELARRYESALDAWSHREDSEPGPGV